MSDLLNARLKNLIVQTLRLKDVKPEEILDHEPLFGASRFDLDSIDALELVLRLEKEFGIQIGSSEESRQALSTDATLADFIRGRSPAAAPDPPS